MTLSLCVSKATLSYSGDLACASFPADAYAIFQVLRRNSVASTSLSFLFSSSQTLALPLVHFPLLHSSFYLAISGTAGRNNSILPPFSIRLQWIPGRSFLPMSGTANQLARRSALLQSSTSHVISLLLPLVSTLLFFRTGGVLSH